MTTHTFHELAIITIERPERYGKQLASHISHKTEVVDFDGGWQATIGTGLGTILPRGTTLLLEARADDTDSLEIVKNVLGRHLLQFTTKLEPFEINWVAA